MSPDPFIASPVLSANNSPMVLKEVAKTKGKGELLNISTDAEPREAVSHGTPKMGEEEPSSPTFVGFNLESEKAELKTQK